MDRVLLDTGPLVALFNVDDKQNQAVKDYLRTNRVKLLTTHAVITEACYLLNYDSDRPVAMLTWLARGMDADALEIREPGGFRARLDDVIDLMAQYVNVPMDYADASLVRLGNEEGISRILTFDSDFRIYRMSRRKAFEFVLDAGVQ